MLEFENYLSRKGLSETTKQLYIFYYIKFYAMADEINQDNINNFLIKYPNVVAKATIKSLLEHKEITNIKILRVTGRRQQKIPRYYTEAQVMDIGRAMEGNREKLMLLVTYYGGLRRGELLSIIPKNIEAQRFVDNPKEPGYIKVYGKGNKEGMCGLPRSIMKQLIIFVNNQHLTDENEPIWQRKRGWWVNKLSKAGIKALGEKVNPHALRHTRATVLRKEGYDLLDLKEFLRHSDIQTLQLYAHVDREELFKKIYQE